MSYFHFPFFLFEMSLLYESLLQAIVHAVKLPVTNLPRFCCNRETDVINNKGQPSINLWHACKGS